MTSIRMSSKTSAYITTIASTIVVATSIAIIGLVSHVIVATNYPAGPYTGMYSRIWKRDDATAVAGSDATVVASAAAPSRTSFAVMTAVPTASFHAFTVDLVYDNSTEAFLIISAVACMIAGSMAVFDLWKKPSRFLLRNIAPTTAAFAFLASFVSIIYVHVRRDVFIRSNQCVPIEVRSMSDFEQRTCSRELMACVMYDKEICRESQASRLLLIPLVLFSAVLLTKFVTTQYVARRVQQTKQISHVDSVERGPEPVRGLEPVRGQEPVHGPAPVHGAEPVNVQVPAVEIADIPHTQKGWHTAAMHAPPSYEANDTSAIPATLYWDKDEKRERLDEYESIPYAVPVGQTDKKSKSEVNAMF